MVSPRAAVAPLIFFGLLAMLTAAVQPPPPPSKSLENSTKLAEINWNYYNVAALGTAILVVGAGLSALMSLFLPVVTYKICYMLGGCQETLDVYVDQLVASDVSPRRQKRSLEYIEPILMTLANAYEKYADNDVKKKSNKPRFYTK